MIFGESVTVQPAGGLDEDGNPIDATGSAATLTGCVVEPLGGKELVEYGRSGASSGVRIYVNDPLPRTVTRDELVIVRGVEYAISNDPIVWRDPAGSPLGGVVIDATRGEG